MNVYEKLQVCRVELAKMNLKKSGKNSFSGYDYFELSDILPPINELFLQNKLFGKVTFVDNATLTIYNTEKPEESIIFESPIAEAQLKGCHPVQNLGAVQTYIRRYLYTNALEVTDADVLDATHGKPEKQDKPQPLKTTNSTKITQEQVKRLYTIAEGKTDKAKEVLAKFGYSSAKEVDVAKYESIVKEIQA
jgi:hypothetical protein